MANRAERRAIRSRSNRTPQMAPPGRAAARRRRAGLGLLIILAVLALIALAIAGPGLATLAQPTPT